MKLLKGGLEYLGQLLDPGDFLVNGDPIQYYISRYNSTWKNERCVEINWILNNTPDYRGVNKLEIGNVLSHYYYPSKDIIDKYEKGTNVKNIDILKFNPERKYESIISISTIEHVGEDEGKPLLAVKAIKHIKTLLAKNGRFLCTIPAGYNKKLDKELPKLFSKIYCMKKLGNTDWQEVNIKDLKNIKYDYKNYSAKGVYLCIYDKV